MSYQVIARKYRPQRFADVVGQDHVTQTLSNAIQQNRIAHAYLFCGPRGTGKTTIARIFAKCLNCTGGPKADFDDADPRCREIAEGRSLDVLEIDGASNRGIEEIRSLRETVKYVPATSKFKIYIIDEVHMLTKEAFNALLKTLEEPPAHVKFMFATTEPEKVLPTILSRCQRFDLRRIPSGLIVKHLTTIAKQEGVTLDDAALHAVARGAEGGMRDAESTLDQLISFCGTAIVEADVLSMFGLTARGQILRLARAILRGDVETTLRDLDELARNGKDLSRLLADLLNHFRNLLIFQISRGDRKLLEVSEDEAASLAEDAPTVPTEAVTRLMEVLAGFEWRLREAASKRILMEVALLKAIQVRSAVNLDAVLKQLATLRASEGSPADSAPPSSVLQETQASAPPVATRAPAPAQRTAAPAPAAPAPEPDPTADAGVSADASLADLWTRLVDAVGRASAFTKSYLLEAHPISLTRTAFTVGIDPEFADHLALLDNAKNQALLQTKLKELGAGDVHVKFLVAEAPDRPAPAPTTLATPTPLAGPTAPAAPAPAPAAQPAKAKDKPASQPFSADDFKNDPLIQKALELFKGQIVDVRS